MSQVSTTWVRIVTSDINGAVMFTESMTMWPVADGGSWNSRYSQVSIAPIPSGNHEGTTFMANHTAAMHEEQCEQMRETGWVEMDRTEGYTNDYGRTVVPTISYDDMCARGKAWRAKKEQAA